MPSGGGTPGGSDTHVQYNSSGSFAGSSNFTWNNSTSTMNSTNITSTTATVNGWSFSVDGSGNLVLTNGTVTYTFGVDGIVYAEDFDAN